MKPIRRRSIEALVLAAALVASACGGEHEASPRHEALAPIEAELAVAERVTNAELVELRGIVRAERIANLSTRVMAAVTAVHARRGDSIRKGQLLVEIDPQTARGQEAQARGALGQARAALALAQRNYERFEALAAADAASELELDQARMQYEQALGAVEQAEGALAASSSVASESQVVAPFAGRVAQRMVEVGDMAAPGRPLFVIESTGTRRLVVTVPEGLMNRSGLAVGDVVDLGVDSRPELGRLAGTVVETTPGADPTSHSYEVEVELPFLGESEGELRTGAAGRTWIPVGERSAVIVRADAVLRRGGTRLVVVRGEDGSASSRVVTVGTRRVDGTVEVLSGLKGGETVVVGLTAAPPAGTPIEPRRPSR